MIENMKAALSTGFVRQDIKTITDAPKVETMRMAYDSYAETEENLYKNNYDYVRYRQIELLAEEIRKHSVEGAVAEVGVDFGDTSVVLNKVFSDRTLYLYDTFDGFDERDINVETNLCRLSDGFFEKWKSKRPAGDALMEYIRSRLPIPNQAVFRRGYFPATAKANDSDERFAFVILDVDLKQPTYEGLQFMYPRLSRNGYIMIHDYHSPYFKGLHEVVDAFIAEHKGVGSLPIPDQGGSMIIQKLSD